MMPFHILGIWFRGLLSIVILAGAGYLLARWYDDSHIEEYANVSTPADSPRVDAPGPGGFVVPVRRVFRFDPGWNRATAELSAAIALLAWAALGRPIFRGLSMLMLRSGSAPAPVRLAKGHAENRKVRKRSRKGASHVDSEADDDPTDERTGEVHTILRPDGSRLRVECYGRPDAPPIVWTHGWGANSTEWFYQKKNLSDRFRLIVWDEPGLGLSRKPDNNDYRLEKLADDLDAVLSLAGSRPAILVGHSIGGMITLTFCKEHPEALASRVAGLVLVHTSYTNPVRTTHMAGLFTAIEKPVLIPLMRLTIALWPLVWLMNWMSYLNGSSLRSTGKSSFCGQETLGQLDFAARFMPHGRPDVLARGMLGMIAYDATAALPRIDVPALVIVGDRDTTTKPEAGEYIAAHIPGAELATLAPAKHMGLIEHHDRFDRLVVEFAKKCGHAMTDG